MPETSVVGLDTAKNVFQLHAAGIGRAQRVEVCEFTRVDDGGHRIVWNCIHVFAGAVPRDVDDRGEGACGASI